MDSRQPPAAIAGAAASAAGVREQALDLLKSRVRGVKVDFDETVGSPAFIASTESFLDVPVERVNEYAANDLHREVKGFLNEYPALFGHDASALETARVNRDYVTAHNKMRTTVWQQEVDGIKVFEALLQAHVTEGGELVNVASRFLPAPTEAAKRVPPKTSPAEAICAAAKAVGDEVAVAEIETQTDSEGAAQRQGFAAVGLTDVSTELVWLPENATQMSLCWQVIFMSKSRNEMFLTLVDTQSGTPVLRHGLTEAIAPASYRVFTGDSPKPLSPGHATPLTTQPPEVARQLVTLDALDTTASPNGWINDGITETVGNNVDAHLDVNADNVADTPRPQSVGAGRVFDPALDLTQPPSANGAAAVVDLFYWNNVIHDRFYQLGFTEAAGNFQTNNFSRGGVGNDAVQADAQDGSGTNNANFSTPPDGSAGRMQMYVYTGPTPDIDGDFDHEIVIHEYTHGLSNRLVGGGVGISALQPRGMGEGWSDFYGLSLLSEATDDVNAAYAAGAYATYQLSGMTSNYYFGIRRYPYSTDLLKNPLTLKDIDPTQASPHTGIPLSPRYSASNTDPAAVHRQGEVWCATLWEARAAMVTKHGFAIGNELMLKLTTDGMKLAPANPNFLQARDAIIQADLVLNSGANRVQLWTAFAKRGMGANATSPASSTTTGVVENYDIPDSLGVSPSSAFTATSMVGSAPNPSSRVYTFVNSGAGALNWTAAENAAWLDLSATSGTLATGATTTITATINASANILIPGIYSTTISFTNITSGLTQQRTVTLTVEPQTLPIFEETWESGTIGSAWTISGTNTHQTLVTTANGPYAGSYHLTMDSSVSDSYARNEATLSVNLTGRSHVFLRFWIKHFSDEPNGPPTSPFTLGADFDGVAISADGTTWYEVQPLRTLSGSWERYTVDLDAAAAARGLTYNSAFKIRFNHYDNYLATTDGFAFDNITIYEAINNSVALSLPPSAVENAGTVNGTLSLVPTPSADVTVNLSSSLPGLVVVPPTITVPSGQGTFSFPITIMDDGLLNGSRSATVTPTATLHASTSTEIVVHDDETATLSLAVPETAAEGTPDLTGTVSISAPVDVAVDVSITVADATEISVPPKVTVLAGQTSAVFPIIVLDDDFIDGTVETTISASVIGWTAASVVVAVADNESLNLGVALPAVLREGDAGKSGTVSIAGKLTAPLTVSLSSSDSSALTVPGTVTILAGQKTAAFALGVVNDTAADGVQSATITATAAGFIDGSATGSVADNDAHHFVVGMIASPQTPNVNFPLTVTAKDANDVTITNFNSVISLSAAGAGGAVAMTPTTVTTWINGVATMNAKVMSGDTDIVITVADAGGHTGVSTPFDAIVGPMHHFSWDPIASPQGVDAPFPVTLRAVDTAGNTVPSYTGSASLLATMGGGVRNVGTGTSSTPRPMNASYHDSRMQSIYLASELGDSATWQSIALNLSATSTTTFQNFTVRIKTTSLTNFVSASFDASGWTEVYRGDLTPSTSGWLTIPLSVPFYYDGTSNIMVDFSADNSATGTSASTIFTNTTANRSVYGYSNSTNGDPRTWNGVVANVTIMAGYTNLRFSSAESSFPVAPATSGAFVGGVWSGDVSVPFTSAEVKLRATDGALLGDSNAFAVTSASAPPSILGTVFSEDFESGVFGLWWAVTGTNTHRTQITTANAPHGGTRHMTMDSSIDSSYSRNEATLRVNLAGRTGVVLQYWVASYGDEYNGPPASPFANSADFDGVAISADGVNWYDVQPLSGLTTVYGQKTVNLDAAIAARGLSYNSNFRIRFNHYDDFSISTDGFGFDDILITADVPVSPLTVTLPTQVTEGSGSATGSVSIPSASASDVVVNLTSKSPAKIVVPATTTILAGQTMANFSMTVLDDSFVDGAKNVVVSAGAAGYSASGATTQVLDNDAGVLTLILPANAQENGGTVSGTVTLNVPSLTAISVALLSDNPLAAQPTATVIVPPGMLSAPFAVSIPDDGAIDGSQTAQLTASSLGWTSGTRTLTVLDNENTNLALTVPATLREGIPVQTGTVTISGTLASNLSVTLNSSDLSEVTVPATVTIPAGQTSVNFAITIVDDTDTDGLQSATITASSSGFTTATAVLGVGDNDVHHLAIAPIGSPQVKNGPISVSISARDIDDVMVPEYTGTVTLTAAGSGGAPLVVSPFTATGFVNGAKTVIVQIDVADTGVVLSATDAGGHTGTSNPFDLAVGNLSAFAWDTIASPQTIDTPFAVHLRAVDSGGNTVTSFNGTATLGLTVPFLGATIGSGTTSTSTMFNNYYSDSRSTSLYSATELGGAGQLRAVAFNFTYISNSQPLTNLTIRLKHTASTQLTAGAWDNAGWTQVYRSSPTIPATGWMRFDFTTPFDFDGMSNLLVDISFDRTVAAYGSLDVQATYGTTGRMLYGASNNTNGDPLTWSVAQSQSSSATRANARFDRYAELPMRPMVSGDFVNGVWDGQVSVPVVGTGLNLHASAGTISGSSNTLNVNAAGPNPASGSTIFAENFESGVLKPSDWTVSGSGTYQTLNTTANTPHLGTRHMTMESSSYGTAARNEATVSLNLLGRTGVTLSFWAKSFSDVPHGPPASPFPSTGADFDGVAISADGGANWYEVQPLRSLSSSYVQYTVNLDAAMAARGLTYGADFKIRFNQYGSAYIPWEGIAIDDILVSSMPPGYSVTLPASAAEGTNGVTGAVARVSPVTLDTVVGLASSAPAKLGVPASVTILAGQSSVVFPISLPDDTLLDGSRSVAVIAAPTGGPAVSSSMMVVDNETATITLTLPTTVVEGATEVIGSLSISPAVAGPISINLASSDTTELTVPNYVEFAAGQTLATFPVTIINDTEIDDTQSAVITATVAGWANANATVQVTDNETRKFTLSGPFSIYEGLTSTGSVSMPGTLPTPVDVTLTSSDPTQYSVPVVVTIPAGVTSVTFVGTAVDDSATDGSQNVTITASAPTFTSGSFSTTARDNDVHHFSFDTIAAGQVRGRPFSTTVYAQDVNNSQITVYSGSVALSAAAGGSSLVLGPSPVTFSGGLWTGNVTVSTLATNATLTASDTSGHTGNSNTFNVGAGAHSRFAWGTVPSTVTGFSPLAATLSAQDDYGNTVTSVNSSVNLSVGTAQRTVGNGTSTSGLPFNTFFTEARSQMIYLASEIGGAGKLTGLAFDFTSVPTVATRFTIRMKHTLLSSYTTYAWETTGWTTVFQGNVTPTATGLMQINFTTPFIYNGSNNLMVDVSFDGTATGNSGNVKSYSAVGRHMNYYNYNGTDPLLWLSTSSYYTSSSLPNLKLRTERIISITPATVALTNGVWSGNLNIGATGTNLTLTADAATGLTGESNPFTSTVAALLTVTPSTSVATSGLRGGPFTPLTHIFTVANNGDGSMVWTVASASPWISLSKTGGTLGAGASTTVVATLNATMLNSFAGGTQQGTISFTNTTNDLGSTTRAVNVTITPRGLLTVTPTGGGNYTLGNSGDAALNWTAMADAWLNVSPAAGTLAPAATTVVNVTPGPAAGLFVSGHYEGSLAVTNTSTGYGNTTFTVPYDVLSPAPVMQSEPTYTGGFANTLQWTASAGISQFEAQSAGDAAFTTPSTSGAVNQLAHTFSSLSETRYYYRVRAGEFLLTTSAWVEATPVALAAGTKSSTIQDAAGIVLTSTPITPIPGRITNPSFESEISNTTSPITGWTRNSAVANQRGAESSSIAPTNGANHLILYTYSPVNHTAGDYISVSQSVNFDGASTLRFDQRNTVPTGYTWLNTVAAEVRIDGNVVWTSSTNTSSLNQTIDVSGLVGTHVIELREQVKSSFLGIAQWVLFDNLRLNAPVIYAASGTLVSTPITRQLSGWGKLQFTADTPANTGLTIDVLNNSNAVLASSVANGTDLSAIPAVAAESSIRLRANLSSSIPTATPRLRNWLVTSTGALSPTATFGSWSNIVASTQDASGPVVTLTSPITTTRSRFTVAGTASDISGVPSLRINGDEAATPATFSAIQHLSTGVNTIPIVATDGAAPPNTTTTNYQVTFTPEASDMDGDGLPDAWEAAHGLSTTNDGFGSATEGPKGDLDLDGIPNLMEYALGLDPSHSAIENLPSCTVRINPADGARYLEFTYRRRINSGITYTVQTSKTLNDWSAATTQAVGSPVPTGDGETEKVTVRILPATGGPVNAQKFTRLHVDLP